MQFGINAFNIGQRNWLVQELLVERKGESSVQTVTVKDCYAQDSSNEVEVRQMIGVDAYKKFKLRHLIDYRFPDLFTRILVDLERVLIIA